MLHVLSQFMQSPRQSHWDAAMRVVRFLCSVPIPSFLWLHSLIRIGPHVLSLDILSHDT